MRFLVLLLILLLPGALPAWAAEAEAPEGEEAAPEVEGAADEAGEKQENEAASAEEAEDEETQAAVTVDDTFIPSTQISEDLSVSFPVDI